MSDDPMNLAYNNSVLSVVPRRGRHGYSGNRGARAIERCWTEPLIGARTPADYGLSLSVPNRAPLPSTHLLTSSQALFAPLRRHTATGLPDHPLATTPDAIAAAHLGPPPGALISITPIRAGPARALRRVRRGGPAPAPRTAVWRQGVMVPSVLWRGHHPWWPREGTRSREGNKTQVEFLQNGGGKEVIDEPPTTPAARQRRCRRGAV
jgi:hypothetical protein